MKLSFKKTSLIFLTLLALAFSAPGVAPAYADESTPSPPVEEVVPPPVDEPVETEGEAEQTATTEEPSSEEPVVTGEPAGAEEPPTAPVGDTTAVGELWEQLPEATELVVLDKAGEALPLVAEDTAKTLAAPDPYFTVGGTLYQFTAADCDPGTVGDQACGTPIQAAIDYLAGLDATPDDNTIYIEAGTYLEDVEIDGLWWTNLGDLVLQGAGSGSTTVGGSLWAYNLSHALTLTGFTFTGDVYVNTNGDAGVNDVTVDGSFTGDGLYVSSGGNVAFENVSVSYSNSDGAYVEADGNVSIRNSIFEDNTDSGVSAVSFSGNITLEGVTAAENGLNGAWLTASDGDITVTNSTFQDNTEVGLLSDSPSDSITFSGVTASGNGDFGAWLSSSGDIVVVNSTFDDNVSVGLLARSSSGSMMLNDVTTSGNADAGVRLFSDTRVDVLCSDFSSSDVGVFAITPGLFLDGVTFSGNTVDYENQGGTVRIINDLCGGGDGRNGREGKNSNDRKQGEELVLLFIVIPQTRDLLPAALVEGSVFGSALEVILTERGAELDSLTIPLYFPIPEGMQGIELAVLFWNGSAWEEVSGGSVVDEFFAITVNQPGFYVLVGR